MNKSLGGTECRIQIKSLLHLLRTIEITRADCLAAIDYPMPDFEDALMTVCAEREGVNFIVTRDNEFLKHPMTISPSEFLPL